LIKNESPKYIYQKLDLFTDLELGQWSKN